MSISDQENIILNYLFIYEKYLPRVFKLLSAWHQELSPFAGWGRFSKLDILGLTTLCLLSSLMAVSSFAKCL